MDTGYPSCEYCNNDAYYRVPQQNASWNGTPRFDWENVCEGHLRVWQAGRSANQRSANPVEYPAPLRFVPATDL